MQEQLAEAAARLPLPHRRPAPLQALPAPTAFTALAPPPRLLLLNSLKRSGRQSATAPPREALTPLPAPGGGGGAPPPPPPPPLTRAPNVTALDEHLAWVGNTYYTASEAGMACGQWALLRRTTLGRLTSPVREGSPLDHWAPIEVAKFESALCLVGKQFALVARAVGTKSTKDVIEFYYLWKQSKNYAAWKEALCVARAWGRRVVALPCAPPPPSHPSPPPSQPTAPPRPRARSSTRRPAPCSRQGLAGEEALKGSV